MTSFYDFKVTLYRDSLSTPWGFRLEGGRDYQAPLTIQRVFTGSPASGDLQRGDIITAIQNRDATHLLHQEANDIIRNSGGSIQLSIRRGQAYSGSGSGSVISTFRPAATAYLSPQPVRSSAISNYNTFHQYGTVHNAEDPSHYVRNRGIEKVKDPKPILSQTGSPIIPGDAPVMGTRSSIKRYRPTSTMPILPSLPTTYNTLPTSSHLHHHNHQTTFNPHSFANTNYTAVPFHDKRMVSQIQQSLNRAVHSPKPLTIGTSAFPAFSSTHASSHSPYRPHAPVVNAPQPQHNYSAYEDATMPAWRESLKKTGADIFELQTGSYHLGGAASNTGSATNQANKPKLVNNQYNTPIGLYSKDNVKEELFRKVGNAHEFHSYPTSSEF